MESERSRENRFSDISSYKNMNPIDQDSILMTSFNLNYFLTPDTVGASTYKFGEWGRNSISSTLHGRNCVLWS